MARFKAIFTASALVLTLGANAFAADIYFDPTSGDEPNSCGEVSNEIPTVTTSVGTVNGAHGRNLRCVTDIDALRLTLHKAGICTSAPNTNDPSSDWSDKCVFIIDDATGIEFTVTDGSTSAIPAQNDHSSLCMKSSMLTTPETAPSQNVPRRDSRLTSQGTARLIPTPKMPSTKKKILTS